MKLDFKSIAFLSIGLFLLIWIIASQIKCSNLQKKLNEERINNLEQVDSLTYINKQHLKTIKEYELQISELNSELDSIQEVKNRIIIQKDDVIISNNASAASNLLKNNLKSWKE